MIGEREGAWLVCHWVGEGLTPTLGVFFSFGILSG